MRLRCYRQKSLWLKEGDSDTKLLHKTANAQHRMNHIGNIVVGEERMRMEEGARQGIVSLY